MKRYLVTLFISILACVVLPADSKTLNIAFSTEGITGENATVVFGFTKESTPPSDNSSESSFVLKDTNSNPLDLIGVNSSDLNIYWNILSADKFAIAISSKSMAIQGDTTHSFLDFEATVTPYINASKGTENSAKISKENAYGVGEENLVYVYTHDPSLQGSTIGNSGVSAISFETEDAAMKPITGEWQTVVTLTYRALGETNQG